MTKSLKREFKFFTVPQWQEEQDYLRQRHREGWRFSHVRGLAYHFEPCVPEDVVYQLDFNPEGRAHKEEYIQMFQDCGWEYLQDFAGYSYFRKPVAAMVLQTKILPLLAVFLCIVLPQFFLQNSQLLMGAYAVITVCYSAFLLHFAWKYWALCQT